MLAFIGVLAIIAVVGFFIMVAGYSLFSGAIKLLLGIVACFIFLFAIIGFFS